MIRRRCSIAAVCTTLPSYTGAPARLRAKMDAVRREVRFDGSLRCTVVRPAPGPDRRRVRGSAPIEPAA